MTAIITDVHYRMSLALIRDLAQAGVQVVCCEREGSPPALGFASKYTARSVTLPQNGWLDALYNLCAELAKSGGSRPALLPVGAATLGVLAAEETRQRFAGVCGLCIPSTEQLDLFNSKAEVHQLAQKLDIPVPKSYAPRPGQDLEGFFWEVPLPCVIKPLCGEKLGLPAAQRYAIARTVEDAMRQYGRFSELAGEPPQVLEYLPGSGLGCSVLAEEGRVLASICHRRVREYPVSGGPSACCDCVPRPDLTEWAAQLVSATGYTGLAMFEFKEDGTGHPRLLEVNPRVWGTFPLTRISRSGLPLLWCRSAWNRGNPGQAEPLPSPPQPRGCRMHFIPSDLASAVGYAKTGRWGLAFSALWDLLRPSVKDGLWEWGDPKPGMLYIRSLFTRP